MTLDLNNINHQPTAPPSHRCLLNLPSRPTAAELLQHAFIQQYSRAGGSRQRELDEAVKALKTHIQIHKGTFDVAVLVVVAVSLNPLSSIPPTNHPTNQHTEWKITPQMVELLAKELRIKSSDLREYLDAHLDHALLLSATASSFKDAHASPSPASAAGGPGSVTTASREGGGDGGLDFSFSAGGDDDEGAVTGGMVGVGGPMNTPMAMGRTTASAVSAVTAAEPEEAGVEPSEGEEEEESLQAIVLKQHDELDRLRTEVIPPMEDLVEELRRQLRAREGELVEAHQVIADLRRRGAGATE